jgi:hypothetical protein
MRTTSRFLPSSGLKINASPSFTSNPSALFGRHFIPTHPEAQSSAGLRRYHEGLSLPHAFQIFNTSSLINTYA